MFNLIANLSPQAKKLLAIGGAAILVIIIAILVFSSIGRDVGTLEVRTSSPSAEIRINILDENPELIGTGSAKKEVAAGTYQVVASDGEQQTSAAAVIKDGQTTKLDLSLYDLAPSKKIAGDAAKSILEANDTLFYINTSEDMLYSFGLGQVASRPYMSGLGAVEDVAWLAPTQFFSQNTTNNWSYINGQTATLVTGSTNAFVGASTGFNAGGGMAYVMDDELFRSMAVGETPAKIGPSQLTNPRTNLANDGSVLLYSPVVTDDDPEEPVVIFTEGQTKDITTVTKTINGAAWSPDSALLAYATAEGIFVLDKKSLVVVQVASLRPSHQQSLVWVGNNNLLYAQDNGAWNYDVKKKQSYQVSDVADVPVAPRVFSVDQDGQTVRFGSEEDGIYQLIPNYHLLDDAARKSANDKLNATPAFTAASFAGFEALTNNGVTTEQQAKLRFALGEYAARSKTPLVSAAVMPNTIQASRVLDAPEPFSRLEFNLRFNSTVLKARFDYAGFSFAQLVLFDGSGTEIYNSGPISELAEINPSYVELEPEPDDHSEIGDHDADTAEEIPLTEADI